MDATEKIRSAFERTVRGLTKRPEVGKFSRTAKATLTDGLTCQIGVEAFKFVSDMPEVAGANGTGPSPSQYVEAALVSCLAIGYRMSFAARGLPVDQIDVEVTGSFDARGLYGVGKVSPGFDGPVRYAVNVVSPANEEAVVDALNWAEAHSPLLHILREPVKLKRELNIACDKP